MQIDPTFRPTARIRTPNPNTVSSAEMRDRILFHLKYTRGKDWRTATDYDKLAALECTIRDFAVDRMIFTQEGHTDHDVKRVYYLSMEYLMGRLLYSNTLSLGLMKATTSALKELGLKIEDLADLEEDAGLGNGGLGRLAACFLDSLATMEYPAIGYGIRYEHGMFKQEFVDGWQMEQPDSWLTYGNSWEMVRPEHTVPVLVYGRVAETTNARGGRKSVWVDWEMFEGVPYDVPVLGYGVNTVNLLRLWSSRDSRGFRLDIFNQGEYVRAVEEQNWAENISKVLYPSDHIYAGKELRLLQEYFLVCCSIRDLIRRYQRNHNGDWEAFSAKNAVQLNDTHPALAVAELMRYLHDESELPWDKAWDITVKTLGYTNHTLMPEALERWPVDLLQHVLPRHLQIIYEINRRFLQRVEVTYPGEGERIRRMSVIEEGTPRQVRMANLAMIGSHSINGVAELHSRLLREHVAADFADLWPEKFNNKTNGITQRRWLLQANPALAEAVTQRIGPGWIRDLEQIRQLEPYAEDEAFREEFMQIKRNNKVRLARMIRNLSGVIVSPDSMFDVQVKRLHEYKRQLLNAMHIITLYHRIKKDPRAEIVPRTFLFGAKSAPSYSIAKLIIKLINSMAETINGDPDVAGRLRVAFLPDYRVSLAEAIIPAADLSEQISTAGREASGTGNMKLSLNGALTIGTWDGANIEIAEEVGEDNIFIFGHKDHELKELWESGWYKPAWYVNEYPELEQVMASIRDNHWAPEEGKDLFGDLYRSIMDHGDPYFHTADYKAYIDCQDRVAAAYADRHSWARTAILNVARMGKFSSDRTIRQYAEEIWGVKPFHVVLDESPKEDPAPA